MSAFDPNADIGLMPVTAVILFPKPLEPVRQFWALPFPIGELGDE